MMAASRPTAELCALVLLATMLQGPLLDAQGDPQAGLVGSRAPSVVLKGLDGSSIDCPPVRAARTQLRLIVFCASWSRHSDRQIALLKKLWPAWSKKGVQILAVNAEAAKIDQQQRTKIQAWVEKSKMPFPVAIDEDLKAFRAYGVVAIPTTLLIDDQDRILMRMSGFPVAKSSELLALVDSRLESEGKHKGRPLVLATLPHRRSARLLRMARVMMDRGKMDMAEYSLKKAIKEDPDQVEARALLAALYRSLGKSKLSKEVLDAARARFPDDTGLLLEAAEQELETKAFKQATEHVSKALTNNPAFVPSLLLRGRIELAMGEPARALTTFQEAHKVNPLNSAPLVEAAKVLELQGKKQAAFDLYEQAFNLLRPEVR